VHKGRGSRDVTHKTRHQLQEYEKEELRASTADRLTFIRSLSAHTVSSGQVPGMGAPLTPYEQLQDADLLQAEVQQHQQQVAQQQQQRLLQAQQQQAAAATAAAGQGLQLCQEQLLLLCSSRTFNMPKLQLQLQAPELKLHQQVVFGSHQAACCQTVQQQQQQALQHLLVYNSRICLKALGWAQQPMVSSAARLLQQQQQLFSLKQGKAALLSATLGSQDGSGQQLPRLVFLNSCSRSQARRRHATSAGTPASWAARAPTSQCSLGGGANTTAECVMSPWRTTLPSSVAGQRGSSKQLLCLETCVQAVSQSMSSLWAVVLHSALCCQVSDSLSLRYRLLRDVLHTAAVCCTTLICCHVVDHYTNIYSVQRCYKRD
jgi:hypothetical protein